MKRLVTLLLLMASQACWAADYDVSVTRKDSNLYKVDGKEIYIHTRHCYEYVYSEDSMLRMSGTSGEIVFMDEGEVCDVKGVYGDAGVAAGKYRVSVSQEEDDWYEAFVAGLYIRTSMCLNLALMEDAILNMSGAGYGTLIFLDSDDSCMVEGVYEKLRL